MELLPPSLQHCLSSVELERVRDKLLAFAQTWNDSIFDTESKQLNPDQRLRLPLLVGMINIDLHQRCQKGQLLPLEFYLQQFPELAEDKAFLIDLICAEMYARREDGETVPLSEIARRFPNEMAKVLEVLEQNQQTWSFAGNSAPTEPIEQDTKHSEPERSLPEQFGRYRIIRKLGKGGMGTVYLAHDNELDRSVALKVTHLDQFREEIVQRFIQEAKAAAGLEHPLLCPVYDVGEIDGIRYITMPYLEGKTLQAHLAQKQRLTPSEAVLLVQKLASALVEAHSKGIVHRDLKPANIMINRRDEPVIMDFGLARHLQQQETRITHQGSIIGTPAYMSPEQVEGQPEQQGPACDIYALGVILYELLTGKVPFEGSMASILSNIVTTEPKAPSEINTELDAELDRICLRAMAKKPEDRYQSMEVFANRLNDYLEGNSKAYSLNETIDSPSTPFAEVTVRKSHFFHPFVLGAIALVMIVGGVIFYFLNKKEKIIAVQPNKEVHDQPKDDPLKGWILFQTPGNELSIRLPGQPKTLTETIKTKLGDIVRHQYVIRQGKVDYSVAYSDYPPGVSLSKALQKRSAKSAAEAVLNDFTNPEVLERRELSDKQYPGYAIRVRDPEKNLVVEARTYLSASRLYLLLARYPASSHDPATLNAFFQSLQCQ